jgi:ubiquinone/menaquinone biosynthesis C-methylase UbiE
MPAARRAGEALHHAGEMLRTALTRRGEQDFLGARWTEIALDAAPRALRYRIARRLLSLSPHYVYVPSRHGMKLWPRAVEIEAELARNRRTRETLVHDLLAPRLPPESVVLDYGCGPGFAAAAVSKQARTVYGADIAPSILSCAALLNGRPNVEYLPVVDGKVQGLDDQSVDLVYSFAVLQHLTEHDCRQAFAEIFRVARRRSRILLHVILDAPDWPTEQEWFGDLSTSGRRRARYTLQCFTRPRDEMVSLVRDAGFDDIEVARASDLTDVQDDIRKQHIVTASRP